MADKIYVNSQNQQSTLVVNDIQTLKGVSWKEIEEKGDRTDIKLFSSNRAEYLEKRKKEFEKGYLTEEEYKWLINKFFKTLASWNALYITQAVKYDVLTYEVYLTYQKNYTELLKLQEFLEDLKINKKGQYVIDSYIAWNDTWQNYYSSCDTLDTFFLFKKQDTTIIKIITQYQLNNSNTECPSWQATDEGWLDTMPETKEKKQALWGRSKYYYANDTFTRNHPYLIQKATDEEEDEPIDKDLKIELTQSTQVWTARGLKAESNLRLIVSYYDMSKVSFEVDAGSGVSLEDTEEENIKKVITPTYQSEMSSNVKIKATAKDGETILGEVYVYLYKKIVGSTEATYLGCFEKVPLYYSHDGYADNLVLGDWWLCKSKSGVSADTDFMFANTYELVDLNTPSLRDAWEVVTDLVKLKATISDNIAIGGYAIENGQFKNIVVSQLSKLYEETYLYGKTMIGEKESENLIINATSTFNACSTFKNNLFLEGKTQAKGNFTACDILPQQDNIYNLGSSSNKWNNLYVSTINGKPLINKYSLEMVLTFSGKDADLEEITIEKTVNVEFSIFPNRLMIATMDMYLNSDKVLKYVNKVVYEIPRKQISEEEFKVYFPNDTYDITKKYFFVFREIASNQYVNYYKTQHITDSEKSETIIGYFTKYNFSDGVYCEETTRVPHSSSSYTITKANTYRLNFIKIGFLNFTLTLPV